MSRFSIEDMHQAPRRKLFTVLGVVYFATPQAWFSLVYPVVAGFILSLIFFSPRDFGGHISQAMLFGVAILGAYYLHGLGHIVSGHLVHAPMQANLVTATVQINLYDDAVEYPSWVHIGRTVGGPIANCLAGGIALLLYMMGAHFPALLCFLGMNIILALAILPGPSLDGEVIVRELRQWKPRQPQ